MSKLRSLPDTTTSAANASIQCSCKHFWTAAQALKTSLWHVQLLLQACASQFDIPATCLHYQQSPHKPMSSPDFRKSNMAFKAISQPSKATAHSSERSHHTCTGATPCRSYHTILSKRPQGRSASFCIAARTDTAHRWPPVNQPAQHKALPRYWDEICLQVLCRQSQKGRWTWDSLSIAVLRHRGRQCW